MPGGRVTPVRGVPPQTRHRHLGRISNRRLPPQQQGPDPALSSAGAPLAKESVNANTPLAPSTLSITTIQRGGEARMVTAGGHGAVDVTLWTTGLCKTNNDTLLLQLGDQDAAKASQQKVGASRGGARPPPGACAAETPVGVAHVFSSVSTEAGSE